MKIDTDSPAAKEAARAWARVLFGTMERGRKTTEFLDSLDGKEIPIGDGRVLVMNRKRDGNEPS